MYDQKTILATLHGKHFISVGKFYHPHAGWLSEQLLSALIF